MSEVQRDDPCHPCCGATRRVMPVTRDTRAGVASIELENSQTRAISTAPTALRKRVRLGRGGATDAGATIAATESAVGTTGAPSKPTATSRASGLKEKPSDVQTGKHSLSCSIPAHPNKEITTAQTALSGWSPSRDGRPQDPAKPSTQSHSPQAAKTECQASAIGNHAPAGIGAASANPTQNRRARRRPPSLDQFTVKPMLASPQMTGRAQFTSCYPTSKCLPGGLIRACSWHFRIA